MRDQHDFGGPYARDGGWSGGGRSDDYTREPRDYPAQPEQNFRGRGPKNWRRDDDHIRATVNELLTQHAGIDATDVDVTVDNGEVTLNGTVGSRWQKRPAEDIAGSCRGVQDVHNRLRLADRETQIGKASE
ncbi:MAG TPA: BON domain-containing protein [Thermoanaerobaculia bacterium]